MIFKNEYTIFDKFVKITEQVSFTYFVNGEKKELILFLEDEPLEDAFPEWEL